MTDVATSLPDLDLLPKTTIAVTLSDASAKITALVVHGTQAVADTGSIPVLPPLLAHDPASGGG